MPTRRTLLGIALTSGSIPAALTLAGCGTSAPNNAAAPPSSPAPAGAAPRASTAPAQSGPAGAEPQHIQVQHVLIGFRGSVQGKPITRTQDEAKTLAYDILKRAQGGASFDDLVKQYTDDSPPGIYGMSNRGVQPAQGEYPREGMVPAFGNVGFTLKVGDYGVADYDPRNSPYGYHVIKRLK